MRGGREKETKALVAVVRVYLTMEQNLDLLFWAMEHKMTKSAAVRHMILSTLHRDGVEIEA